MKKFYITPEVDLVQFPQFISIVTTSSLDGGGTGGGNMSEAPRRGQADWDDDDE